MNVFVVTELTVNRFSMKNSRSTDQLTSANPVVPFLRSLSASATSRLRLRRTPALNLRPKHERQNQRSSSDRWSLLTEIVVELLAAKYTASGTSRVGYGRFSNFST